MLILKGRSPIKRSEKRQTFSDSGTPSPKKQTKIGPIRCARFANLTCLCICLKTRQNGLDRSVSSDLILIQRSYEVFWSFDEKTIGRCSAYSAYSKTRQISIHHFILYSEFHEDNLNHQGAKSNVYAYSAYFTQSAYSAYSANSAFSAHSS